MVKRSFYYKCSSKLAKNRCFSWSWTPPAHTTNERRGPLRAPTCSVLDDPLHMVGGVPI